MEKNVKLANIYIKLHNKKQLTFDDMAFLAKYDRECFEKTCQNVFYKKPEAKKALLGEDQKEIEPVGFNEGDGKPARLNREDRPRSISYDLRDEVETVLARLRTIEREELPLQDVDAAKVRNLIGSLYMELLFPHNDSEQYFDMSEGDSSFNVKV